MRAIVVACALFLGGCKSVDTLVSTPTPAEVSQYAGEIGTVTVADSNGVRRMYSSEYLLASVNYTNQRCDEFFDLLARFNQDSSFIDKLLAASITAATPLMASYGVGANAVAVTGATIAYGQNVNKFASEIYAFSPYAGQLKRHVKQQMADYLKGMSADWKRGRLQEAACDSTGGCYNELERLVVVRGRAQQYANICSISNMRAIIDSSLANTDSKCKTPTGSDSTEAAAELTTCKAQAAKPNT
uniref:Lipoprotein n=1 Tax=Bradyrhizobium quebecense TaxID=2748629 RepID=A0ABS3MUD2_9BRAD